MSIVDSNVFGLNTVAIPNPAAGADFSSSLSAFARFQIISINFTVVADVNVANRLIRLNTVSDTYSCNYVTAPGFQTASETINYYCGLGMANQDLSAALSIMTICLPDALIVQKDDDFVSDILTMQAGDQISNIRIRYKYWWTL